MDRKPAHDVIQPPNAGQAFGLIGGLFLGAVYGLGCFWSLLTAKPRTIGLKAYWLDYFIGFFLMAALCTCQVEPDRTLFQISFVLMNLMFWFHLLATLTAKEHVLMHSVGRRSRWLEGIALATVFFLNALGEAWIFTCFVLASCSAQMIRDGMIAARDKVRAANMADAVAQQEYAMNGFDAYRR